jgi:hypothetical protein
MKLGVYDEPRGDIEDCFRPGITLAKPGSLARQFGAALVAPWTGFQAPCAGGASSGGNTTCTGSYSHSCSFEVLMLPSPAVPRTLTEVTPSWLTEALRTAGCLTQAKVVALSAQCIGLEVGFLDGLVPATRPFRNQGRWGERFARHFHQNLARSVPIRRLQ